MDISTNAAGLKLSSPLLPGSGPLTGDAERILYLARQGLGAIVTNQVQFCFECGAENETGAKYCSECGTQLL